jgi:hypothetical protein
MKPVSARARAGIRPIDKPEEFEDDGRRRMFDATKYTTEELEFIREALALMLEDRCGPPAPDSDRRRKP